MATDYPPRRTLAKAFNPRRPDRDPAPIRIPSEAGGPTASPGCRHLSRGAGRTADAPPGSELPDEMPGQPRNPLQVDGMTLACHHGKGRLRSRGQPVPEVPLPAHPYVCPQVVAGDVHEAHVGSVSKPRGAAPHHQMSACTGGEGGFDPAV